MGAVSSEFKGVSVIRIDKSMDFGDPQTVEQIKDMIRHKPGTSIHGSLECTAWTTWQNMCVHLYGAKYRRDLIQRRKQSRKHVKKFIEIAELCLANGGEVSFEWPMTFLINFGPFS